MRKALTITLVAALALFAGSAAYAWTARTLTGKVVMPDGSAASFGAGKLVATPYGDVTSSTSGGVEARAPQEYPIVAGVLTCTSTCTIVGPGNYEFVLYRTVSSQYRQVLRWQAGVTDSADALTMQDLYAGAVAAVTVETAMTEGEDAALLGSGAAADNLVLTTDGLGGAAWEAETGDISGVTAGTGLSGGGSSGAVTVSLADTAVTPGAYTSANITVDQQGRLTAAANGSGGAGDIEGVTAGTGLSGGGTSGTVTLSLGSHTHAGGDVTSTGLLADGFTGSDLSGGGPGLVVQLTAGSALTNWPYLIPSSTSADLTATADASIIGYTGTIAAPTGGDISLIAGPGATAGVDVGGDGGRIIITGGTALSGAVSGGQGGAVELKGGAASGPGAAGGWVWIDAGDPGGGDLGQIRIGSGSQAIVRIGDIAGGTRVGIGVDAPTAALHLPAGTATASTAPLKLGTGGVVLTTPEAQAVESTDTHVYWTNTAGTRLQLDQQVTLPLALASLTDSATAGQLLVSGGAGGDPNYASATGVGIGIRAALASAAGLYVPWITGDAAPTAYFGAAASTNDQTAIEAHSWSGYTAAFYSENDSSTPPLFLVSRITPATANDYTMILRVEGTGATAGADTIHSHDLFQAETKTNGTYGNAVQSTWGLTEATAGSYEGYQKWEIGANGALVPAIYAVGQAAGGAAWVGINQAAATAALDVAGDAKVSGDVASATLTLSNPTTVIYRLASTQVNVGSATVQALYTVPSGKTLVVTQIVLRGASGTFDQATDPIFNIGCAAAANGVVTSATYTTPGSGSTYLSLALVAEVTACTSTTALNFNVTQAATASTTATVDVFGYVF